MNKELELYYANRFALFKQPGWLDLMEDMKRIQETLDTLHGVTVDNLQTKQGELTFVRWILDLERVSNEAYQQLSEEKDADV